MGSKICGEAKLNDKSYQERSSNPDFLKRNIIIKSKRANKNLDVCQDKEAFGILMIYEDFGQPNQRFDIVKQGAYVYIISHKSGKYLTVGSNSDKNGAPIFEEPTSIAVGQKFRLDNLGGNEYFIHTFCGKVLDVNEQETSNGTKVIQYDFNRKDNQIWIIQ